MIVMEENAVIECTIFLPNGFVQRLEEVINALNKKAAKLGVEETTYEILETSEMVKGWGTTGTTWVPFVPESVPSDKEPPKVYTVHKIYIKGFRPQLPGWAVLGFMDGLIVQSFPGGAQIPFSFRPDFGLCDHCNTRRQRNITFIVQNEDTGEILQVGSSCVKDFSGHKSPAQLASYCESLALFGNMVQSLFECDPDDMDEEMWGEKRGTQYYSVPRLLAMSHYAISHWGYVSRSNAKEEFGECATADGVSYAYEKGFDVGDDKPRYEHPSEENYQMSKKALEWAKGLEGRNEFDQNLRAIAELESCTMRHIGFVAYMMQGYLKSLETKRTKATKVNEHFGTIKKREEFVLRVLGHSVSEGYYGVKTIWRLQDEDGRAAVWFATGTDHLIDGELIRLKATVKDHGKYNELAQTVLTRCAYVETLEEVEKK